MVWGSEVLGQVPVLDLGSDYTGYHQPAEFYFVIFLFECLISIKLITLETQRNWDVYKIPYVVYITA